MSDRPIIWPGHKDATWLAEKLARVVKGVSSLEKALNDGEETKAEYLDRLADLRIHLGVVVGSLFAEVEDADEINDLFRFDESGGRWICDAIYRLGRNSKYWKLSYPELLKLPDWQRKRLDLLKAKRFRCEACDDSESSLHVHHKYYGKGLPWNMPNEAFEILCEHCHKKEHAA